MFSVTTSTSLQIVQRLIQDYLYEHGFMMDYQFLLPLLLERFEKVYMYDFGCRACNVQPTINEERRRFRKEKSKRK
jgi:hypothetical protein